MNNIFELVTENSVLRALIVSIVSICVLDVQTNHASIVNSNGTHRATLKIIIENVIDRKTRNKVLILCLNFEKHSFSL